MTSPPTSFSDKVVQASIDLYNSLRNHGKPARRPNNVEEWTVLATISLVFPSSSEVRVVSLGTGVKVLPANRLPPLGDAVHDSHAEVLAKRGFVRWMMEEAKASVPPPPESLEQSEEGGSGSGSGSGGSGGSRARNRRKKREKRLAEKVEMGQGEGRPGEEVGSVGDSLNLLGLETILEDGPTLPAAPSCDMTPVAKTAKRIESGNSSSSSSRKKKPSSTTSSPLVSTSPLPGLKGSLPMSRETSGESTTSATSLSSFLDLPKPAPGFKGYTNQSLPMSKTGSKDSTTSIKSAGQRVVPGSRAYYDSATTQSSAEDTDRGKVAGKRSRSKKAKKSVASPIIAGDGVLSSPQQSPEVQLGRFPQTDGVSATEGGDSLRTSACDAAAVNGVAKMGEDAPASQSEVSAIQDQDHQHMTTAKAKTSDETSEKLFVLEEGKFRLREGIEVWLYVSTLPCGDASMLHTAAHQDPEVAMNKSLNPPHAGAMDAGSIPIQPTIAHAVRGRNGYDNFGAVRTKPGRADSTPTISLSCSDKIATWTVMGLQGAMLEPLFEPVYLTGIVVGGVAHDPPPGWQSQGKSGKSWRAVIKREIERALWGRLGSLIGRLPLPYDLHPPAIHLTDVEFHHSKPVVATTTPLEPVPSTLALSYVPVLMRKGPEILFNGTRQANTWKPPGTELLKVKARALVCKMDMMRAYLTLLESLNASTGLPTLPLLESTMYDLKHTEDSLYQYAKTLVRGVPHKTDTLHAAFGKDLGPFEITVPPGSHYNVALPPFSGWIISGKRFESFTRDATLPFYVNEESKVAQESVIPGPNSEVDLPVITDESTREVAIELSGGQTDEEEKEDDELEYTLEEAIIVNIPKRHTSTRADYAAKIPSQHRYPTPPPCFD